MEPSPASRRLGLAPALPRASARRPAWLGFVRLRRGFGRLHRRLWAAELRRNRSALPQAFRPGSAPALQPAGSAARLPAHLTGGIRTGRRLSRLVRSGLGLARCRCSNHRSGRSVPASPWPPACRRAACGPPSAPGRSASSTDSSPAPRRFRGCWCSARAGSPRGRRSRRPCPDPAGSCGTRSGAIGRKQLGRRLGAEVLAARHALRRRRLVLRECRGSTISRKQRQRDHARQDLPASDASFSTTMTSIRVACRRTRGATRIRCLTHNCAKVRPLRAALSALPETRILV